MIHRALVVESSSFVLDQYKEVLLPLGVEVVLEKDGYRALGLLLKENFDSLVVSSHIPTIDGSSLVTILKMVKSSNQSIPSILVYQGMESYNNTEVTEAIADHCLLNDRRLLRNLEMVYFKLLDRDEQREKKELPPIPEN